MAQCMAPATRTTEHDQAAASARRGLGRAARSRRTVRATAHALAHCARASLQAACQRREARAAHPRARVAEARAVPDTAPHAPPQAASTVVPVTVATPSAASPTTSTARVTKGARTDDTEWVAADVQVDARSERVERPAGVRCGWAGGVTLPPTTVTDSTLVGGACWLSCSHATVVLHRQYPMSARLGSSP